MAPIYRAYALMDELSKAVLGAALQRLDETSPVPTLTFLSVAPAWGWSCSLATNPACFRALFIDQPNAGETVTRMRACLRRIVDRSPKLRRLSPAVRDELIMDLLDLHPWSSQHGHRQPAAPTRARTGGPQAGTSGRHSDRRGHGLGPGSRPHVVCHRETESKEEDMNALLMNGNPNPA